MWVSFYSVMFVYKNFTSQNVLSKQENGLQLNMCKRMQNTSSRGLEIKILHYSCHRCSQIWFNGLRQISVKGMYAWRNFRLQCTSGYLHQKGVKSTCSSLYSMGDWIQFKNCAFGVTSLRGFKMTKFLVKGSDMHEIWLHIRQRTLWNYILFNMFNIKWSKQLLIILIKDSWSW